MTLTWKDLVLPSTNEYKCPGGFRSKFYANQDVLDLSFLNTRKFDDDSIWRLDFLARRLTLPAGKPRVDTNDSVKDDIIILLKKSSPFPGCVRGCMQTNSVPILFFFLPTKLPRHAHRLPLATISFQPCLLLHGQ